MSDQTYLDYNATCPLKPEVFDAMKAVMMEPHNASSVHQTGRKGSMLVENAREQVSALVNAPTNQVIFNSGATEGNNTVIQHFKGEPILVSAIEHDAVLKADDNLIIIKLHIKCLSFELQVSNCLDTCFHSREFRPESTHFVIY